MMIVYAFNSFWLHSKPVQGIVSGAIYAYTAWQVQKLNKNDNFMLKALDGIKNRLLWAASVAIAGLWVFFVGVSAHAEQLDLVDDTPLVLLSDQNQTAGTANAQTQIAPKSSSPQAGSPAPKPVFSLMPPPELAAKAYILIDANTGYVMAAKNADEKLFPASLTKVLSLYLVASQLKHGEISLDSLVPISKRAWQTGGSRMFVQVGTQVPVIELIKGVAIVSGNDATVALAEYLGGTEDGFVQMMNQTAQKLQMNSSSFADCNGLHDSNYSTASDLAKLTSAWIRHFPDYYGWFKEKWFSYQNIKQPNRNRLLWRDEAIDGVKTGYTSQAGYCLIASAVHGDTRLIAVVLGAAKEVDRLNFAQSLLNYGFRYYESKKLFSAGQKIATSKVALGKQKAVDLGLANNLYITAAKDKIKAVTATVKLERKYLRAPLAKGAVAGVLKIKQDGQEEREYPLVVLQNVAKNYWFMNILDYVKLWFFKS